MFLSVMIGSRARKAAALFAMGNRYAGFARIPFDEKVRPFSHRRYRMFFQLFVDGKIVHSASGKETERLHWVTFDTAEFIGNSD
jgi:hypothetical protein